MDFGLARQTTAEGGITQAGLILGTPLYMAPEQAQGERVDGRSDLYSLGVVLFQLCTGQPPFAGKDTWSLLAAVLTEAPPDVGDINPELPPALARLIMRLLAKQADDRPASAQEVVEALEAIERDRAKRPWQRSWACAAVLLAGAFGAAGYFFGPTVYRVATNQGALVITTEDGADVEVIIKKQGGQVRILDLQSRREINLDAGDYEIVLTDGGGALRLSNDRFTLTRGGRKIVTVERVPAGPMARADAPAKKTPPKVGEIRSCAGHESAVSGVAFTANGLRAVSGSLDKTVRLWDLATGNEQARFEGPTMPVRCVAVSADGKRLASGGSDREVRLWQVETTREARAPLRGHEGIITGLLFAAGDRRLVSASLDRTVRVWDTANGKGVNYLQGDMGPVECLALSPDGNRLVCGGQDQLVHVWNVGEEKHEGALQGHTGTVLGVAFAPDGGRAASAGSDGTLRVWDLASGQEVGRLAHPDAVQCLAFLPDGKRVLAGCRDGTLRLWDLDQKRELHCFQGPRGKIWSVAVSADGLHALSGGDDGVVRLWGLPAPERLSGSEKPSRPRLP